jgi:hypothetical protein
VGHLSLVRSLVLITLVVLHPYYKLNYIKLAWGGEAEQEAEIRAGNRNAKNWQREAEAIIEATVCMPIIPLPPISQILKDG